MPEVWEADTAMQDRDTVKLQKRLAYLKDRRECILTRQIGLRFVMNTLHREDRKLLKLYIKCDKEICAISQELEEVQL